MLKRFTVFMSALYMALALAPLAVKARLNDKEGNETQTAMAADTTAEQTPAAEPEEEYSYKFDELEDYVTGVVAAEMPASFNEEALKAQAVCARTYAIRYMEESGSLSVPYDIYQAYCTVDEMRAKWGDNFDTYYAKVKDAVKATEGEIMLYNDEPVLAVFHSMSGGKTENSENIWGGETDYLKSVDSSFDEDSPGFIVSTALDTEYVKAKLKEAEPTISFGGGNIISVAERTEAGYVKTVKAGDKTFTGKQIRELLGLRSANFTVEERDGKTVFTTKGFGHGAGMSQYGANHMAEDGSGYRGILSHYYTGVEIAKIKIRVE